MSEYSYISKALDNTLRDLEFSRDCWKRECEKKDKVIAELERIADEQRKEINRLMEVAK